MKLPVTPYCSNFKLGYMFSEKDLPTALCRSRSASILGRGLFKMVEDEGGQGQRLLFEPEAELFANSVLQTEAADRRRYSIAGLLRLGDCRGGLSPDRAGVRVEHGKRIGAGKAGLIRNAILNVRACHGL